MTDTLESFSPLAPIPIRVLAVLAEKQRTVPDSYPLTLNALISGCNQKTSRHPIMELSESQVQQALEELRSRSLVTESSGGRAYRYAHNADRVLKIPSQSLALLTVLMLRGPQTAGELRLACDRMHNFADISSVEAFLDELSERAAGALVRKLPRQAGAREARWVHLLGGEPVLPADDAPTMGRHDAAPGTRDAELASLQSRVSALEEQLGQTNALLARVCAELGVSTPPAPDQTA
ncbi:YceH family protein [Variovorax dokdonensis]|uniref:YceH family protein n=1 Tax=Variovorax dokdonensis TaxID=344883 RepID=A0ABT7NGT5_9BURK|nr:YceH family protein [Variovorax dokdonensis]MDM0047157.1 YceH family protein [Variovorax dokdonensis]